MIGFKVSREPKAMNKGRTNHTTKICVFWANDLSLPQTQLETIEFSLNIFTEFSDKDICHYSKRAQTCDLLC